MLDAGCTGLEALNPICQAGSIGGSVASSGFESVLSGISQWVASGAEWLLNQIGQVLSATTTVDLGASWFQTHYGQMTALAGVVILPMLLASTLQAIVRQNPGQLIRTFLLQLPLALLLAVVAVQIVILSLSATDAMSDAVAGGTSADVSSLLNGVTSGLVESAADPSIASFVLLLVSLLIAVGAFVLWLELLIRAAAVYVAVLFLPHGPGHPGLAGGLALVPPAGRDAGGPDPLQVRDRGDVEPGGGGGLLGHGRHRGPRFGVLLGAGGRRPSPHGHVRALRHPAHDPGRRGGGGGASRRVAPTGVGGHDPRAADGGESSPSTEAWGDGRLPVVGAGGCGWGAGWRGRWSWGRRRRGRWWR